MTWSEQEVEVVLSTREDADPQLPRKIADAHAGLVLAPHLRTIKVRSQCAVGTPGEETVATQKITHVITTLSLATPTLSVNPSFVLCLIFKANVCR